MMRSSFIPLAIATIVLILAGGLYGFGYYSLSKSAENLTKLKTEVLMKTAELDRAARSRAALVTLAGDEATVEQFYVDKDNIVPFLATLQATGKAYGATVSVLSVSDDKSGVHPRLTLALSITGSFDAVMRTLGTIENAPYDGELTNLTLDSTGATPKGPALWTAATVLSVGVLSVSTTTKP